MSQHCTDVLILLYYCLPMPFEINNSPSSPERSQEAALKPQKNPRVCIEYAQTLCIQAQNVPKSAANPQATDIHQQCASNPAKGSMAGSAHLKLGLATE